MFFSVVDVIVVSNLELVEFINTLLPFKVISGYSSKVYMLLFLNYVAMAVEVYRIMFVNQVAVNII